MNTVSINTDKLLKNQRGASLVEYALLVALLMLVAVIGVAAVGESAAVRLDQAGQALTPSASINCVPGASIYPACLND